MARQTERGGIRIWRLCASLFFVLSVAGLCFPQTAPSPVAPLPPGWTAIDERFVVLTVELCRVEASLDAVNKALVAAGRGQARDQQRAENYAAGNTLMDERSGGPMDWSDFYGKTARNFYYHSSGTLDLQGPVNAALDAKYQGKNLTTIERPPQFDYIYRANSDAQKRAETDAAALGKQIDQLLARRRELEIEQSALWCRIALRGLSSRELNAKALYRFDLPAAPADQSGAERLAAIAAGCKFMRTINVLVKQAQPALDGDQASVLAQLQQAVDSAREDFASSLLDLSTLADTLADAHSELGQFDAATKRLDELSQNLVDAYRLAGDGDRAGEDQRKDNFRGQFQRTIIDFSATVLSADDALSAQAADWKILPDTSRLVASDATAKQLIVSAPTPVQAAPPSMDTNPVGENATSQPTTLTPSRSNDTPLQTFRLADVDAINSARERIAGAQTRQVDTSPLQADLDLSQTDMPYEIKGVVHPGLTPAMLHILVHPGVELRGGKINLEAPRTGKNSKMVLAGSGANPIVLRNVEIDQPLGSQFSASHVIFDQCTFRKTGGWFSYYSSKWPMDQCLFYRCTFGPFNGVNLGFRLTNCTFVGMDFTEITHRHDKNKTFDYMDRLRKDWNIIASCNFVDCSIPPTVFWCSESSNFFRCVFLPGPAFDSATATVADAFVQGTTGDTPDQINQSNPPTRAPLTISLRDVPFPVARWAANCPIPELRFDERYAGIVLER
jgi:hypothetical protein